MVILFSKSWQFMVPDEFEFAEAVSANKLFLSDYEILHLLDSLVFEV